MEGKNSLRVLVVFRVHGGMGHGKRRAQRGQQYGARPEATRQQPSL